MECQWPNKSTTVSSSSFLLLLCVICVSPLFSLTWKFSHLVVLFVSVFWDAGLSLSAAASVPIRPTSRLLEWSVHNAVHNAQHSTQTAKWYITHHSIAQQYNTVQHITVQHITVQLNRRWHTNSSQHLQTPLSTGLYVCHPFSFSVRWICLRLGFARVAHVTRVLQRHGRSGARPQVSHI